MGFLKLASKRYSVRSYKPDEIEQEKLDAVIEAGRVAPTACNNQPQKIYVVKSAKIKEKLAAVCRYTFGAPVILVIGYDKELSWKNKLVEGYESGETDAAIVTTHMMLEAEELGLGTCWVAYFNYDEVKDILGLPENIRITTMMPIGYPSDDAAPSPRHALIREITETVTEV